jgi:hypothetical protein
VGADFPAVEDLAAAGVAAAAAGVAAAAAGAATAGAAGVAFCTPPWPLQVPLPVDVEVVPSLQVLVAPEAAGAAGAAGAAAGAAAAGAAEAAEVPAFWTPPWPLQVPLPVEAEVVPSLQVVGVESAQAGSDNANIIKGAAMSLTSSVFFMNVHSRV